MKSKNILLVGGGGHCKSVLDSLLQLRAFSKIGLIDVKENIGKKLLNVPVIGCDEELSQFFSGGYKYAFVTIGSIGNPTLRIKLFNVLIELGFEIPPIIDSTAIVSPYSRIEKGVYIGKNVVVNAGAVIQKGAIINTGAIIEHDCIIGEFTHVAPGTVLSGEVQVGENTHIGANCVIKQQLKIGSNSIIGIGSVVLRNIEDNIIAYGNPCKGVEKR